MTTKPKPKSIVAARANQMGELYEHFEKKAMKQSKQAHTPTPYEVDWKESQIYSVPANEVIADLCVLVNDQYNYPHEANAKFIVRACNSHEKLITHCQNAINWIKNANKMMETKGCGWVDASDSLNIAIRDLTEAITNATKEN